MSRQSARLVWVVCLTLLLTCGPALPPVAPAGAIFPQSDGAAVSETAFLDALARDTWTYLHSSQTTAHHLPYSWWSSSIPGGDYANPAEIGLYALAWLAAYDLDRPWSPSWSETEAEVGAILDQLRAWQTGSQAYQPHGPNAYQNSVFYQWYWISWNPPVVGANVGDNAPPFPVGTPPAGFGGQGMSDEQRAAIRATVEAGGGMPGGGRPAGMGRGVVNGLIAPLVELLSQRAGE